MVITHLRISNGDNSLNDTIICMSSHRKLPLGLVKRDLAPLKSNKSQHNSLYFTIIVADKAR